MSIVVPFDRRSQTQGPSSAQPTPQQILMALATMKDLGRLDANAPALEPKPK